MHAGKEGKRVGTAERRTEIMRVLYRRRHEKISNLAEEFGVSVRTILRDIEVLSATEPIYTQCGRYYGGVYIMDNYSAGRIYMSEKELAVLRKLLSFAQAKEVCSLNEEECSLVKVIIAEYTKPNYRKENRHETKGKRAV